MMAHAPVSGSDPTSWMARVRRSKKPATSGLRCALAWSEQDGGKLSIVPPSGCRAKSPTPPRTRPAQVTVWALVSPPRAAWQWRPMFPRLASPRLRHDADVGLRSRPALRVDLLGLFVRHRASDDHILTLFPIHGRLDPVLGRQLKRVDYPEPLVEVAPGGNRIDKHELNLLVRPDHEHVAYRQIVGRGAPLRGAARAGWEHPVELGDRQVGVADHRVVWREPLCLSDVLGP